MDITSVSYGAIFLLLLLESTVVLGLFAPGVFALIGGSFLAATGQLDPIAVFAIGWVGVFAGDACGYVLGRNAAKFKWVKRLIDRLTKSVAVDRLPKSKALVFFQFPVVTRAPTPLILGSLKMPVRRWLVIETAATTMFVAVLFGLGYIVGRVTNSLDAAQLYARYLQLAFFGLLVIFVVVALLRARASRRKRQAEAEPVESTQQTPTS